MTIRRSKAEASKGRPFEDGPFGDSTFETLIILKVFDLFKGTK